MITFNKPSFRKISFSNITFRKISSALCRWVSNFNGVDSYAQFDNTVVLIGDFSISVDLNLVENAGINVILGNFSASNFISTMGDEGNIRIRINNEDVTFDVGTVTGVSRTLTVDRVGFDITAGFDGVSQTVTYSGNGAFSFDLIAKNNLGYYLESIISNLTTIGSTVIDLPMDEQINTQTGNIDYINRSGDANYNATGYNVIPTEICSDKEVHVFVMGGQSNMVGWVSYDGLGDYPIDVLQLKQDGVLTRAVSPLDNLDNQNNNMALTISFCNAYLADNPNVTILLVQCAKGGTSFQADEWGVGNTYYDIMKSRTTEAMQSIPNAKLKGHLWHQGEFDQGNATYQSELDAQILDYKSFCAKYNSDLPVILGQLAPEFVGTNTGRQAIQDIITDTPNRLEGVVVALSDTLLTFDNTHFDSASLRTLGERYYTQYYSLQHPLFEDSVLQSDGVLTNSTILGVK